MKIAAMLMGLVFPACAATGSNGVPPATPFDLAHLHRPTSPNTALLAPARPDIAAPLFAVPPERLYRALRRIAEAQPRTYLQTAYDDRLEAHYVARSAFFNFPDLVTVAAEPDGQGSRPVIWSRSLYGHGDLGVNRRRVAAWLALLQGAIGAQH